MITRQYEKAATALDGAIKLSLKPEQAALVYYWLGQARFQLKQYVPAEEAYTHIIREYRKSEFVADAYWGAGLSALRQKKTDTMRQLFQELISRYPKSPDRPQAMLILAQTDMEAKRYREARSEFEALLRDAGAKAADKPLLQEAEDGLNSDTPRARGLRRGSSTLRSGSCLFACIRPTTLSSATEFGALPLSAKAVLPRTRCLSRGSKVT